LKILLVTDSFPPEIRSASYLMQGLTQELKKRGHELTVITSWPGYNLEDGKSLTYFEKENENGVTVLRIKTLPHHNVNYFIRGVAQLLMPFQFLWKLWKYGIRSETCIIYSPPLPLALVGLGLRFFGVKSVLNLQDLFPQNAIDLGVLRNPLQIAFFRSLESLSYRFTDFITVHSEGNRRMVMDQYPSLAKKIHILHNWVDLGNIQSNNTVDFRKKWSISHPLIAVFTGVMGPSQYLELLLYLAEKMQDNTELLFLLVGDGQEKFKLQELAREKSLSNVRFEGFVSLELYHELLSICSIGLVCLSPLNKTPVVPGKILGYMAAGLPIAAFLQNSSDGHKIIKSAQCGFSSDSADKDTCVQLMKNLVSQRDSFVKLGQSGKRYAIKNFSKEVCVSQLESILEKAAT